jgi:putative peptidoglycan lipid II flippase
MINKLLNSQQKTISAASLVLAASYLLSSLLGLLRDRLLAGTFGGTSTPDIYYAAFTVPDFVALILIMGAISAAVIPIFSSYLMKSKEDAWKYVSTLLNVFLGFLILTCVIFVIIAPLIISFTAPGFSGAKKDAAVLLMRIMFLSPIILGASNMISGILQVFHRFLVTALAPLLYNAGIIIGILYFYPAIGISGLAWGVVLGGTMHLLVQLPSFFYSGFRWRPNFNIFDPGVVKTIKLMIPRSLGLGALQINTIAITAIASTLAAGSIAVFNWANNLSMVAVNAVAVSVTTAAFPIMSMAFLQEDKNDFIRKFSSVLRQMIFITMPLAILLLLLRAQIVRVILGVGKFSWADTELTTACLGIFALNLIAPQLILFLSKAFYAAHNTKIPALISIFSVTFNIVLSLFLVWLIRTSPGFYIFLHEFLRLGQATNVAITGLALAYSITGVLQTIFLLCMFWKKFPSINNKEILDSLYKILIASLAMGFVVFWARNLIGFNSALLDTFWGVFLQLVVPSIFGCVVYFTSAHFLKSPETRIVKDTLLKKFLYSSK